MRRVAGAGRVRSRWDKTNFIADLDSSWRGLSDAAKNIKSCERFFFGEPQRKLRL